MAKDDFYIVNSWMIDELGLSGIELQCFAIIWSLSRGEKQMYIGGNSHLVKMTKKTEQTIITTLKKLCSKGYIKKFPVVVNNVERNYYKAISYGAKEILVGGSKNFSGGTKKILPPNIESNIESNNKEKKESDNKLSLSKKSGNSRFVKPTIEEVDAYIKEKGYHFDAEQFWNHYESVGWMIGKNHMKDWHCACATWEGRRKREIKEKEDSEPSNVRAPMDVEQWERNQRWMEENTPKYVGRISFDDFISMRGEVMLNSRIYGDILKEMHQSGYEGDIVAEFKRRNDERICSHG